MTKMLIMTAWSDGIILFWWPRATNLIEGTKFSLFRAPHDLHIGAIARSQASRPKIVLQWLQDRNFIEKMSGRKLRLICDLRGRELRLICDLRGRGPKSSVFPTRTGW